MTDQATHEAETGTPGLFAQLLRHVSTLLRREVDLARAELNENVHRAGAAIGMIVAGLVIALSALNVLSAALVAAVANLGIGAGWAAVIVGGVMALIAFILAGKGVKDLKLSSLAPTRSAENLRRDAEALRETTREH